MVEEIITIFCICDDYLNAVGHRDNCQARTSSAEVLTTAIVSAKYFGGNYSRSRCFMKSYNYIPRMISESRFIRRIEALGNEIVRDLFEIMAQTFKLTNPDNVYAIDSFPVPVCLNARISRCKIYTEQKYMGFCASKNEYFYGIKVHMLVSKSGKPVEFIIKPGSFSDISIAREFKFDVELQSKIHADKGYTDYEFEDYLELQKNISFAVQRKSNAKRRPRGYCGKTRKVIETTFSQIVKQFAKKIHAVTAKGFELKIVMFIFAYAMDFLVAT